ncbi:MAG: family 16 glycosylhydrolase [Candidatus Aureabacteria bacterium]|nr:family 16 glycosylhydrolase [Candidatus Auribacterota bacterium]
MKRVYKNILFFICLVFLSQLSYAAVKKAPERPGWILIWNDEFEGSELDPAKWRVSDTAPVKNKELEYYTPEDVYLENGCLILRSQKRDMGGREYTSGHVDTKGRFLTTYGRIETRAKMPGGQGIWPAHWMLPIRGIWPPEIDIMELLGHAPDRVYMTVHWGHWPNNQHAGKSFKGPDFTKDFHVFAVEWEPEEIRWYVDDVLRYTATKNIPKEPFYIILNTAVGGEWPGNPNSKTRFPQYHYIDYVRVYIKDIKGTSYLYTTAENGKVSRSPDKERYKTGDLVSLSAKADLCYRFSHWEGDAEGKDNPLQLKMDRHRKIKAVFEIDPAGPQVISKGRKTKSSSLESPELDDKNAVDGDMETRWSSAWSDPQWIKIDLGAIYKIIGVKLYWETAYARAYDIQVSSDGAEWKTVYSQKSSGGGVESIGDINAEARYIRVFGKKRATDYGYSLWEVEVFGENK